MKKIISYILFAFIAITNINAQKYFTKTGEISFYSQTPIENIKAVSNTATTVYDSETGNIQWAVLIKSFAFEKSLMQEHFNENYMESSTFPKASFKGQITNLTNVNLQKDGSYSVDVEGELTIHGVTNVITAQALFLVAKGAIKATCSFKALVADYGIEIPSVVKENIAKEIEININAKYEVLDKS